MIEFARIRDYTPNKKEIKQYAKKHKLCTCVVEQMYYEGAADEVFHKIVASGVLKPDADNKIAIECPQIAEILHKKYFKNSYIASE